MNYIAKLIAVPTLLLAGCQTLNSNVTSRVQLDTSGDKARNSTYVTEAKSSAAIDPAVFDQKFHAGYVSVAGKGSADDVVGSHLATMNAYKAKFGAMLDRTHSFTQAALAKNAQLVIDIANAQMALVDYLGEFDGKSSVTTDVTLRGDNALMTGKALGTSERSMTAYVDSHLVKFEQATGKKQVTEDLQKRLKAKESEVDLQAKAFAAQLEAALK